jgi:N-methylhydantoinase A
MHLRRVEDAVPSEIEAEFAALQDEARERLAAEGVPEGRMSFRRTIAMRYLGQWRSLSVAVDEGLESLDDVVARFHAEHEREFAYHREDAPVELYELGLQAVGITPKPELARHERDGVAPEPVARRPVVFDEADEPVDTPVYDRAALPAGCRLDGPAVVQQLDSTIVVPPGVTAEVDEHLIIRMEIAS